MSDAVNSQTATVPNVQLPDAPATVIEEIVDAQQSIVDQYVRYAVGSLDRLQCGDFDVVSWGRDLGVLISATSTDAVRVMRAFARLRAER